VFYPYIYNTFEVIPGAIPVNLRKGIFTSPLRVVYQYKQELILHQWIFMLKKRSKKLNAIQLEFQRLGSNTARTKKLQELHRSVYIAAEQSHLERKRIKTLAKASRLRESVPNNRDSSVKLPDDGSLVDPVENNLGLDTLLTTEGTSVKSFGYEELCIGLLFGFLIGIQLGIELGVWKY
jgi:hypothetical protein